MTETTCTVAFAQMVYNSPVRVNPVKRRPISKSPSKLATPVETPAKPELSSTWFASFDRVFTSSDFWTGIAEKPLYNTKGTRAHTHRELIRE